ncbi:DNA translocase FtsK [Ligilactobacillus cholophilus]|uniref:DNA translocase FtsK n=1 Tax=Ligilactobacillus cholophilus TaxID=3050131 RepID=UPI0025B001FC|nr:DNA translocase FtsK [Ligilactobacillus cholophilus]
MKHYDGPAFFRRAKNDNIKKQNSEKNINENEEENKVEPVNEYNHKEFHPSYIPPSVLSFRSNNLRQKYKNLIFEIKKEDDNYLLFDDSQDDDVIDLIHKELDSVQSQQVEEDMTSTEEITDNEFDKQTSEKDNEQIYQHEIYNSEIDQSEIMDKNIEDTKTEYSEPTVEKISESTDEDEFETKACRVKDNFEKNSEVHQFKSEKEDEEIDVKDESNAVTEEQEPEKNHALNKSLSDILSAENNAQHNLKIFDTNNDEDHGAVDMHNNEYKGYQLPPLSLLPAPIAHNSSQTEEWALSQSQILNETFKAFNVKAEVKDWTVGPTVTQFEVTLALGVKVSKITNLADDLKLALAAKDIRIEAPISGKSSVGIEIPNKFSRPVMLSEVLNSPQFKNAKSPLTVALGVDLFGIPQITNIHDMPHGLIAGATGSGKSVFINSLLVSLLYKATPQDVKLLLIDPKTVEMAPYEGLPHLLAPVISDPQAATASLKWAVEEMNQRYEKLAAAGVRDIDAFNKKAEDTGEYGLHMPYIVIIIDELADLMMTASAEISDYIGQITAKARACGIHLLVATQRPSVDVITGTMKNNIPTRIAFMVSSQIDSRTIIDSSGAEKLLGKGDMLYLGNGKSQAKRLQGTYINDDKIDEVVAFVKQQGKPQYAFDPENLKKKELSHENEDELLPRVLDYIVNEESISTSKLQRVFSIGYNRAARIIEELEKRQYISPARGSKPRKVFLTQEELDKLLGE